MKMKTILKHLPIASILIGFNLVFAINFAGAAEELCAVVKIEIAQELTFERQAFDAKMVVSNGLIESSLEDIDIDVIFRDEYGNLVEATSNPDNLSAAFFIVVDSMTGINDINGAGIIAPEQAAEIHWLIIPTPGAANGSLTGKLYFVSANFAYSVDGEPSEIEVAPDFILVKPQPELELDYFLPVDVYGDDPFTPGIEPPIPFNLGVRVTNVGLAPAQKLKIESSQPKIVENQGGLLVAFEIIGAYVDNNQVAPTLLLDFGTVPPNGGARTGRWVLESSLSGMFTSFSSTFSHSDELGGKLTSLLNSVTTHFLIKDVLVDLPGRDSVKDFLAKDPAQYRVYESEGGDTVVTDYTGQVSLIFDSSSAGV
ncbi:MAG: hypothetical protein KDD53_07930, partial [Bdellovibrionales bacterium]|nr:hypothetical protein [Bdellovibrionales bacterium]